MKTHKNLDVWSQGVEIAVRIYKIVKTFPSEEKYGLVDQIKRAAVSIPSNIAEGAARNSKKEFLHFLGIALGSIAELETQLVIAKRLDFFKNEEILKALDIQKYKLLALVKSINKNLA